MWRPALLALLCTACVSLGDFRQGMNRLIGQPAQVAFDRLGYPDRSAVIEGKMVYYWGTDESACSFKVVTVGGVVQTWDAYGSPTGCSIYLKGLSR
jgi:hypothetical protein